MPSRNGRRPRKVTTEIGVQRMLAGAGGTGRKGAIAVPMVSSAPASLMQHDIATGVT